MAVDIKDVEQVAQDLQQKFDDFKAKNDKRIDAIEQEKSKLAEQVESLNGQISELENLKSDLEKSWQTSSVRQAARKIKLPVNTKKRLSDLCARGVKTVCVNLNVRRFR